MMHKSLTVVVLVAAIGGLACYAQTDRVDTPQSQIDVGSLQRQRIKLLEERVSIFQQYVVAHHATGMDVVAAQMDVINARLDYVATNVEKRNLLTDLIGLYDQRVEVAELEVDRPIDPNSAASGKLDATSNLLLLKSERLRVKIERDMLD